MFLASLQLANHGKLDFVSVAEPRSDGGEQPPRGVATSDSEAAVQIRILAPVPATAQVLRKRDPAHALPATDIPNPLAETQEAIAKLDLEQSFELDEDLATKLASATSRTPRAQRRARELAAADAAALVPPPEVEVISTEAAEHSKRPKRKAAAAVVAAAGTGAGSDEDHGETAESSESSESDGPRRGRRRQGEVKSKRRPAAQRTFAAGR